MAIYVGSTLEIIIPCSAGSNCPWVLNPTWVHFPPPLPICWRVRESSTPKGKTCLCVCSVMSDSVTLWTVPLQGPLSMGFTRQEYWNGLPFPPLGDLPNLRKDTSFQIVQSSHLSLQTPWLFVHLFIYKSIDITMCQALYQEPGFTSVKTQSLPSSGLCSQGGKQTLNKN